MPTPLYMTIVNDQGTTLEGEVAIKDREGTIEVLAEKHAVWLPIDSDTGTINGTRKHDPIILTKSIDSITPYLYEACTLGKTLQSITIDYYSVDKSTGVGSMSGMDQKYFTKELSNVKIARIEIDTENVKEKGREHFPHIENIYLSYEEITWTYLDGNVKHKDSWLERTGA